MFYFIYRGRPNPFDEKLQTMHKLIDSMLLYPDWSERPSCTDILSRIVEWAVNWEHITKYYSYPDLRSIFINFTENQFLYKFLSVKTGKGFDKIILSKLDSSTPKIKNQISSVYRSNSVSMHWKHSTSSGSRKNSKAENSQATQNILDDLIQAEPNKIDEKPAEN